MLPLASVSTKNAPVPTYATSFPSGDQAGTTSSPVCPTTLTLVPSQGARFRSDGMLRWANPGWPALAAVAGALGAPDTVWPAAEKTISQPAGAKRGAWRYHQVSFVLKNGRAFDPSTLAIQRPSGCPCVRCTYTMSLPSG